jgi:hydroxymethylglutaryl-CoA lyase
MRDMDFGVTPFDGLPLPTSVTIYEVGPRDGLQNESTVLPAGIKAEFIERLVDAGNTVVETASFVHPKLVPQLADAEEVLRKVAPVPYVRYPVSLEMLAPVVAQAREAGMQVRGYLSMCFGDLWEGKVSVLRVLDVATRMMALGCTELSIGVAIPGQVTAVLDALIASGIPVGSIAVHFHDTYDQALANALTALRRGITTFDTSAGGLGGCPYAQQRHRQPRHRGPAQATARPGHRDRHRPAEDGRHKRLAGRAAWSPQPVQNRRRARRLTRSEEKD